MQHDLDPFDLGPYDRKKFPRKSSTVKLKNRRGTNATPGLTSVKDQRRQTRKNPNGAPVISPGVLNLLRDWGYTKRQVLSLSKSARKRIIEGQIPPHIFYGETK